MNLSWSLWFNLGTSKLILLQSPALGSEQVDTPFSDVESFFSLDDDYSPQALAIKAYSTSEEDSNPDNDDDSDAEIQIIYTS